MKCFFLLGLIAAAVCANAQERGLSNSNYNKMPYWIEMIKNPNVNYYEAITAYEEFWKGKKNPLSEDVLVKDTGHLSSADKKERILYLKYLTECQKFERWKSSVKPLVQPDGRIIAKTN